ncbi:MAG: hypothetical protein OWQ54_06720 [Sulfolobaceae archaeon]|nr:hypothetical protein [Sulfolobaceae archaeon]
MEELKGNALRLIEEAEKLLKQGKSEDAKRTARDALRLYLLYLMSKTNSNASSINFPMIPPDIEINDEKDIELIERIIKSFEKH